MHTKLLLSTLAGITIIKAQAPSPSFLSATQSGVLPTEPTPFAGVETIEGAITYDGPPIIGFTGPGGNASIQMNNPPATYQAILPITNFDNATNSLITGSITGTANENGSGVMFTVNFTGFPSDAAYGPFVYHIHNMPVPPDGNCTGTLGHLDPTDRGELHACEVAAPQTCQAGDLAGKHGNITMPTFMASYTELYLSTNSSSPYFFGDKSLVIHTSNTTRLTCANFTLVSSSTSSSTSTSTVSVATATTSATAVYTGVASRKSIDSGLFGSVVAVVFSFLV